MFLQVKLKICVVCGSLISESSKVLKAIAHLVLVCYVFRDLRFMYTLEGRCIKNLCENL